MDGPKLRPSTLPSGFDSDADIIGINEIENDGYGPDSAIAFLVDKLNAATAPGTYAFINVDANTGQINALGTDAIKVGMIYNMTGSQASLDAPSANGAKLAAKEINAAGGILGRQVQYTSSDTQSNPGVAKALAQKAVDDGAFVVMGPVFSGSILVSMDETRRASIPNFTGGEAAARGVGLRTFQAATRGARVPSRAAAVPCRPRRGGLGTRTAARPPKNSQRWRGSPISRAIQAR